KGKTQVELAKQVCAFANAGPGTLIYGVADDGSLDAGIKEELVGRQSAKAWVEQAIPALVFPPLSSFEARHFHIPSHHAMGYGLVVAVPLSDRRPHWIIEQGKEVPYIRTGEHSSPMGLQTFLDISHRNTVPRVSLDEVFLGLTVPHGSNECYLNIYPVVRLLSGPCCKEWAVELRVAKGVGRFQRIGGAIGVEDEGSVLLLEGPIPLFPGRPTKVVDACPTLMLKLPVDPNQEVV